MDTVIHEVLFSFDKPDYVLNTLHTILKKTLSRPLARKTTSMEMAVRNALTVLIVDSYQERAHYLSQLLQRFGYHPITTNDSLEAFTLFLQGAVLPFAVLLGEEDQTKHFFLIRLLQQMRQKYDWETLLIRIHTTLPATEPLTTQSQSPEAPFQPQHTDQLSSRQSPSGTYTRPTSFTPAPPPARTFSNNAYQLPPLAYTPVNPSSGIFTLPVTDTMPSPPPATQLPPTRSNTVPLSDAISDVTSQQTQPSLSTLEAPVLQVPFPEHAANTTVPPVKINPVKRATPQIQQTRAKIFLTGQSLGRYQIEELLGSSANMYSDAYRIYDRLREHDCALKAIQTDFVPLDTSAYILNESTLFEQEAELLGRLSHPHILPILNCGESYVSGSTFVYKTMPFCPGHSIASWIAHHGGPGSFRPQQVSHIVLQLADLLQYLHEQRILYLNFKMSNILVTNTARRIDALSIALCDFPLQDGSFAATTSDAFLYISPERWEGTTLPASDQYSVAAIAYELFTGRPPFQGNVERIMKQMHTTMQPLPPSNFNPALPAALNTVLLRALAKNPRDRFASVATFAQALQRCFA